MASHKYVLSLSLREEVKKNENRKEIRYMEKRIFCPTNHHFKKIRIIRNRHLHSTQWFPHHEVKHIYSKRLQLQLIAHQSR